MIVGYGDVMVRDLPKANSFIAGEFFFADPLYVNEVNWYPFASPLLSSVISRIASISPSQSFIILGILFSGLLISVTIAYLRFQIGQITYIIVPAILSTGLGWPDNGYYPFQTARVPLIIYLIWVRSI